MVVGYCNYYIMYVLNAIDFKRIYTEFFFFEFFCYRTVTTLIHSFILDVMVDFIILPAECTTQIEYMGREMKRDLCDEIRISHATTNKAIKINKNNNKSSVIVTSSCVRFEN